MAKDKVGSGKWIAFVGAAMLVATAMGPLAASTPAPPGGTHLGVVDNFTINGETVPANWIPVQGPADAWRVAGNTLQAVRTAGTLIELDPDELLNLVGNQLLGLCIVPEQTINSGFYSGFHINEAPLVDLLLGTVNNLLRIRLNIPLDTIQLIDQAGNILQTIQLPGDVLRFNQLTCINLLVLADLNELLVIIGRTLDSVGHVVDGVTHTLDLDGVPLPEGSIGLAQPATNTARVLFSQLHVQSTPDLPAAMKVFAGPADGQVTLKWTAPSDGGSYITSHLVYRGTTPDFADMTLVGVVPQGYDPKFTDQPYTGIVPTMQKFYYRVTAENFVGEGPLSVAACGIPYPMGLLTMENTGVGCGTHGIVEAPTLEPFL